MENNDQLADNYDDTTGWTTVHHEVRFATDATEIGSEPTTPEPFAPDWSAPEPHTPLEPYAPSPSNLSQSQFYKPEVTSKASPSTKSCGPANFRPVIPGLTSPLDAPESSSSSHSRSHPRNVLSSTTLPKAFNTSSSTQFGDEGTNEGNAGNGEVKEEIEEGERRKIRGVEGRKMKAGSGKSWYHLDLRDLGIGREGYYKKK